MPTGLGGEQLWISATNDNTGTSTAFDDLSGQGNDGTAFGTTIIADTGSGGTYAFDFNGSSDNVTTPFGDTSTTSTGVYSMSCWSKYNSVSATSSLMSGNLQTNKTGLSLMFDVFASDRGHRGLMNPNVPGVYTGVVAAEDRDSVSTGTWYHIAYTGDGTTARLYVNGVEVDSSAITLFSSFPWSNPLTLGCYYTGISTKGGFLDGQLDDARVFNRTITPAEVVHLASSRGVEGTPAQGLGDEELWLCPSLTDNASDITGNGNGGTYVGGMGTVADTGSGGTRAYEFDGTDDYVDCGAGIDFYDSTGLADKSYSVSLWVNPDSYSNGNNGNGTALFSNADNSNSNGQVASNSISGFPNIVNFAQGGTGNSYLIETADSAELTLNTWKHVVFTYSGCETTGCMDIFIDGVKVSSTPSINAYGAGIGQSPQSFKIGVSLKDHATYNRWMNGKVDDFRVYYREITQDEITHLASSRGIEGGPSGPTTGLYIPFINKILNNDYTRRIR